MVWYAYRSCMLQVSDDWVTGVLPSAGLSDASTIAVCRRVLLRWVRREEPFRACGRALRRRVLPLPAEASAADLLRCAALRAFFHTLRAASACLRARLASRFASLSRLRARLSSSLAMRTRCRATSACSRARSSGSPRSPAGAASGPAPAVSPFARSRAAAGGFPADRFSVAFFPMRGGECGRKGDQCHTTALRMPPRILSTEFVNNPVHTGACRRQSRSAGKGLRQHGQRLSRRRVLGRWRCGRDRRVQRERMGNRVAVTRLRPPFLLR